MTAMFTSSATTTSPAVRLGATHGYRFIADEVELNATLHVSAASAHQRAWALQLWACPAVPARADDLVGHLVAEAALPPLAEIADAHEPVVVTTFSQPPAGDRDYSMVLVLAARSGARFDEVHDVVSFPARERFILPRFAGAARHRFDGDRVHLVVGGIENPREAINISGTLSLELWALTERYDGAQFTGTPIAGAVLGSLAGQDRWTDLAFDLSCSDTSSAPGNLVLMLREWVGSGYVTRDYVGLASAPAPAPVVSQKTAPVAPASVPVPKAPVAKAPAAPVVKAPAAIPASAPAKAPAAKAATPASASTKISVNRATVDQLAAVKGLSRAVAERIAKDRPFKTLGDLVRVKGLGEKLLTRIQSQLEL